MLSSSRQHQFMRQKHPELLRLYAEASGQSLRQLEQNARTIDKFRMVLAHSADIESASKTLKAANAYRTRITVDAMDT